MFIIKIIFISILIKFLIARESVRRSDVAEPSSSTTENTLPGQQREDFVIELNIRGPPGGGAGRNVGGTQTGQQGLQQQERQEGDHLNTTVTIQHIRPRREPCCVIL
uniref:Uncharacterized protein n=1 Tax=Meloidogyne enterolobii TaxID=390850 RepID=A0A6V7U7S3_MELEN|nr:unnamed protein product [Meloidogyne enterolobii]